MTNLVLDSGGFSRLAERSNQAAALTRGFQREGFWPPLLPSVVLVEATSGRSGPDARLNRLIKRCDLIEDLPEPLVRRAGALRHRAGRGSAVDAIVVATAEPDGIVFTSDVDDLVALAAHAIGVTIEPA